MKEMQLKIPDGAKEILTVLSDAGFEAFVVGGCVRDALLGREPNDWDICTGAKPEEIIRLFSPSRRVVETGLKHGTVTVLMPDGEYELTTFRIDGSYSDHRHPDQVIFTSSLTEDLARRDFTMNAMAYSPKTGLADPFHGREDLAMGVIRCVGDPALRFEEDGLRIMRAIRFASVYGFPLEPNTEKAALEMRGLLKNISAERLQTEFRKLLTGDAAEEVLLNYREIIAEVIPELRDGFNCAQNTPWHCYNVYRHIAVSVGRAKNDPIIRLTMLLHDIAKPACVTHRDGNDHFFGHMELGAEMAANILDRLKFDHVTRDAVVELVSLHDIPIPGTLPEARRLLGRIGAEQYARLVEVKTADMLARSDFAIDKLSEPLRNMRVLAAEILAEKAALTLKDLAVNGDDLIAEGMKPGPDVGKTLNELLARVMEDPSLNRRETLLCLARESAQL